MKLHPLKTESRRLWLVIILLVLIATGITACETATPTEFPSPTQTATRTSTLTPVVITATPEEESPSEAEGAFLLNTSTPAPTSLPGPLTELVSTVTQSIGADQATFLGLSVEDWINLGISALIVLTLSLLVTRLLFAFLEKVVGQTGNQHAIKFVQLIRPQIYWIVIVLGFQFGTLRLVFIDAIVKQWFNQFYIALYIVTITIALWKLIDVVVLWYREEVEPKTDQHQADTIVLLLQRGVRTLLLTISTITLLSLYNINVNALIAALGIGGLAISLAAQDTLANVISGVLILLDQPFRVGDRIEIQGLGTWGDVVDIGLRTTRIRTRDNRMVIVPNAQISTDQIINYTYPDPRYRLQMDIGISYGQDIEKVRQVIIDTVKPLEGVLPDEPVDALYIDMGESAMIFRIRWWIESYVDTRRMFDRVNTALQNVFDEAGIESPFNTYNIRVINDPDSPQDQKAQESPPEKGDA